MIAIDSFNNAILKIVEGAVKESVKGVYERHQKEIIEELELKKSEAVAGITLQIMERIDLQDLGNILQIRLLKPKK